ncbi:MAG: tRNA (adenosine(37)-N6)-dimethylallyltransferase MiaA [Selenomonas sp.]|uniref:tRNA (adenosine(37)-N6)-dimethylallyltransferase MiaA n=1 Tax=Selenomonas sp. TaxID=2053611 RepID=UPI0025FC74AA|nr:tRNA (adenosine(37)-N6)-dimethylallyltransferase MiaA [Selenomonas sp.]MCI6100773.1 tRNA (adenosine(37)-N6)-dimethylallyltransferase MiaA [Selenomonas sp.]MCI6233385.1 tRNA (adenosine(37)-N6)-dimethylallyltransferase MiaA [Selenomonas sp.]
MTAKPKLFVLLGPTAVGKTALSIELAKALGTEIISGDSMLIYRGFDIGAAKPGLAERQGIVHHLVDIRGPEESYSVQEFQQEADDCIRDMALRGRLPFLVGGTGLYVQSLVEGYVFSEQGSDPAYRAELQRMAETQGGAAVYDLLCRTDPKAAETIHPNNVRRVIRALEVAHMGGETISREKGEPPYDAFVAGLSRPRAELYDRINERVRQMWADGLVDEVRGLLAHGVTREMQAMQGIGYKETAAYLAGECTEAEAVTAIQTATRHFAKRQLTWYRRMKYIHWYDATAPAEKILNEILSDVRGFFRKRSNQ